MKKLFFLSLLFAIAFSQTCVDELVNPDNGGEIAMYAGLAFALVIVGIIIVYIAGTAMHEERLIVLAKDELFHLFMSAILVICVGAVILFSCTLLNMFFTLSLQKMGLEGGCFFHSDKTPIPAVEAAKCSLHNLEISATSMVKSLTRGSISSEMASGGIFGLYTPWSGGNMYPLGAYKKTEAMQLDMIALTFVIPSLISITMQKLFLYFEVDFVKWLIPIAILFRIIPATRNMGNLLFALLIALYAFIPTLYALNGAMDTVAFGSASFGCDSVSYVISDNVMGDCNSGYNFWAVARLLPQAFFLPNLVLAITITFLAAVNKALKVLT